MLAAKNLVKRFGTVTAVAGVSLNVQPGEVVGLLGPNGAGKTTTLRMLAGILPPDEGQVWLGEYNVAFTPLEAKQRIGFLSGDTQLYRRMNTYEVLRYFGRLYGMEEAHMEARIRTLGEELELAPFAARMCAALSSGQKQRANIARAFLHDPLVLILDEPTAALDVVSGQFIMEAIRKQKAAGRAILFSTHIMSEAEYLCDRILLLHEGRIVDEGEPTELVGRSGCANLTDAFLLRIAKRPALEATL